MGSKCATVDGSGEAGRFRGEWQVHAGLKREVEVEMGVGCWRLRRRLRRRWGQGKGGCASMMMLPEPIIIGGAEVWPRD